MLDLITASACIKKLKEDGICTWSKQYFSQLVAEGKLNTHTKPNSPKKWFRYEEVKNAVSLFSSTTKNSVVDENDVIEDHLLTRVGTYPSQADMSEEELKLKLEKEAQARDEAKAQAEAAGVDTDNINEDALEESEFLGKSLNDVKIQKEFWLGKKAEIEYKRQMQEVVSIEEVNKNAFEVARLVRDNLVGMSARLTAMVASENDPHIIRTLIDEEVNRTLSSVSETIYE